MKHFKKITAVFSILFLLATTFTFGQDKVIAYSQLPQTAKTFLNTHFKGVQVSHVIEDQEVFGLDEYKVHLSNGIKVEFDSKGNWKEIDGEHQKIPYGFIPASIKNYSAKTFPNTFITKFEKKRWSYKVELSNGLDLEFDSKGNFKRIDD